MLGVTVQRGQPTIAGWPAWRNPALQTCRCSAHGRRDVKAMDDAGALPSFTSVAVPDGGRPTAATARTRPPGRAVHGLFNAHHLRELGAVTETAQAGGADQAWAAGLAGLQVKIQDTAEAGRASRRAWPRPPADGHLPGP